MNRRRFIAGTVAAISALEAPPVRADTHTMTIDAHAHLFRRGLKLADVRRYAPDYDATVEKYLEQLDRNAVAKGVIVQPSFLGIDNSFMVECIRAAPDRLRGIAVVDPAIAADDLLRLNDAGVVGVRLNLIGRPLPALESPLWQAHLAILARLDWQVEVQCKAAEHAVLAPHLLGAGVNLVIDHFGLPDPGLGIDDPGFRSILTLGKIGRLWVKLSAAYRLGPNGQTLAQQAYPLLKEKLGLDRLLWGSDWPHTQNETTQTFEMNRKFLDQLVPDLTDRNRILASGKPLFRF